MGESEITRFLIVSVLILLAMVGGIIMFILEYRRKMILNENEKRAATSEMQQQTMQFIGREIHDNVGQKLTLGLIYTRNLESENQYPAVMTKITAIADLINESLVELKRLSKELIDDHIEQNDIIYLIKQECDKVSSLNVFSIAFTSNTEEIATSYLIRKTVVRIVQEFIQNSLKHAQCTSIQVTVEVTREGMKLRASDNGTGFDFGRQSENGIGLSSMLKGASMIGGIFNLSSEPGRGTDLLLFIPISKMNY